MLKFQLAQLQEDNNKKRDLIIEMRQKLKTVVSKHYPENIKDIVLKAPKRLVAPVDIFRKEKYYEFKV